MGALFQSAVCVAVGRREKARIAPLCECDAPARESVDVIDGTIFQASGIVERLF